MRRVKTGLLVAALAAPAVLLPGSGPAQTASPQAAQGAQQQVAFSIEAQPLAQALTAFGRQSGYQISFDAQGLGNLQGAPVRGTMTPEDALRSLLAGTGVTWRYIEARSITLVVPPRSGNAAVLPTLNVEGRNARELETAYSPVQGYLARRSATATKTDTPIMETPASIQVIPRQVIEEQGAQSLKDVYQNISGVQQAGNTLNAQTEVLPIIRGFESPVLLRNGMRSTQVGSVDLGNIERVEVLKGPASILYGTLQPGGIVNYVTKRPLEVQTSTVEQQAGSYDFSRTSADVTGPLTENGSALYRVNAAYTNSDSFRDIVELERTAFAPTLLWRPGDSTEILFDASYMRETQPYDTGVPLTADGKPLVARNAFFGDSKLSGRDLRDYSASYQLSHEFNSVWTLSNQLQIHRANATNESLRARGITANNQQLLMRYQNEDRQDDEIQAVVDATAKFATGPVEHTFLVGTDATTQDTLTLRFRVNTPNVGISNSPVINFTPPALQPMEEVKSAQRWVGVYAQDQMALLEDGRLKLLLGGRYDAVHQENRVDNAISPDVNERALTGRAGLLYEFTKQYSSYVSVSQSFRPQSPGTLDINRQAVTPERGLQYETGVKGAFFGDRLTATASVFEIEKTNVAGQDAVQTALAGFPVSTASDQRSRGFEFDLIGALTPQINVIANYAYTDTVILKSIPQPATVGGPIGGVPSNMARLFMTYDFDSGPLAGFGFGGGLRYVDTSTAQFATTVKLQPYTVFDLGAWYKWNTAKLGLSVQNLFDEDYIVRASDRNIAHYGAPLTAIATLSLTF